MYTNALCSSGLKSKNEPQSLSSINSLDAAAFAPAKNVIIL